MNTFIAIMGLQGIGKSRFIAEVYPDASVCDIEHWWQDPPHAEGWKNAGWTKQQQLREVAELLVENEPLVIAEFCGVTEAGIKHARHLLRLAEDYNYHTMAVWLHYKDRHTFIETILDNEGAQNMLAAWRVNEGGKFRRPTAALLYHGLYMVPIDHARWKFEGELEEWEGEPEYYRVFTADQRAADRILMEDLEEERMLRESVP